MRSREIALVSALLALASVAHYLARFTQVGGIQMAPSIAFYCLIPLLLVDMSVKEACLVGLVNGILLSIATSSPFPLANIPSHWIGLMTAKLLVDLVRKSGRKVKTAYVPAIVAPAVLISGIVFIVVAYYGMINVPQLAVSQVAVEKFKARFGALEAFFAYAMTLIVIPTLALNSFVLTPALFAALKPALVRRGFIGG